MNTWLCAINPYFMLLSITSYVPFLLYELLVELHSTKSTKLSLTSICGFNIYLISASDY